MSEVETCVPVSQVVTTPILHRSINVPQELSDHLNATKSDGAAMSDMDSTRCKVGSLLARYNNNVPKKSPLTSPSLSQSLSGARRLPDQTTWSQIALSDTLCQVVTSSDTNDHVSNSLNLELPETSTHSSAEEDVVLIEQESTNHKNIISANHCEITQDTQITANTLVESSDGQFADNVTDSIQCENAARSATELNHSTNNATDMVSGSNNTQEINVNSSSIFSEESGLCSKPDFPEKGEPCSKSDSPEEVGPCSKPDSLTGALFCLTCHKPVTSELLHSGHKTVEVSSAITNQHTQCDSLLAASTRCLSNITTWGDNISILRTDLVKTRKSIAVELDDLFREIEHRLQERKMALFTQLTDLSCNKESYFDEQLSHMDGMKEQVAELADTITQVKKELNDSELLAYHCHKLQEAADQLQTYADKVNTFSLAENTNLEFSRHGIIEVRKSLNSLASVTSSRVIPSKCTASGDGLKKAHVHKQTYVKVTPRNCHAHIEREKGLVLEAHFYNEGVNVECQCIDNGNGTYNILYIAPESGKYHLAVKLFRQHIKGSPYLVNVIPGARVTFSNATTAYELTRVQQTQHHNISSHGVQVSKYSSPRTASPRSVSSAESYSSLKILPTSPGSHSALSAIPPPHGDYLAMIGQYGRRKGDFSNPQGVTVDYSNRIYCTDSTNQNIQIFTDTGSYINLVGKRGRQLGQLLRPIGVCYTKEGCLLFTDYENKCVNMFKDGSFVRRIGQGKLIGPKGITTSPRGTIIVADNKGNQVLEFSINGRLIRKIPSQARDKASQLAGPHYVAVNVLGDIFVSDFHNHCIKVFSKDGVYQRSFGSHGSGNGQFNAPTGLTIDHQGYVLVSDWGNSRIQIFDEDGSFLAHVDTSAAPLFGPQAIYATRDNKVIIADSGNHCVKIFRYDIS